MKVSGAIKAMRKDRKGFQLDNGEWYSAYRPLPEALGQGVVVEFDFVSKGQWKNINGSVQTVSGATSTHDASQAPEATGGGTKFAPQLPNHYQNTNYASLIKQFPLPFDHPDRAIVRQNSLTNAVNLLTSMGMDLTKVGVDHMVDHVLEVAQKFEEYSTGDLERKALDAITEEPTSE
jgi:hypothetical protein